MGVNKLNWSKLGEDGGWRGRGGEEGCIGTSLTLQVISYVGQSELSETMIAYMQLMCTIYIPLSEAHMHTISRHVHVSMLTCIRFDKPNS